MEHLINANYDRPSAIRQLKLLDQVVSKMMTYPPSVMSWFEDHNTYRVCFFTLTGHVEVTCFDVDAVDADGVGIYRSASELPQWIQDRLAVLSILPTNVPTPPIEGIGQRINQTTFWVVKG